MNKPVAWMTKWGDGTWSFQTEPREDEVCIPLYTHPANPYQSITNTKIEPTVVSYTHPVKEQLTDEEIDNLIMDVAEKPTDEDLYDFAKAILKKAFEK